MAVKKQTIIDEVIHWRLTMEAPRRTTRVKKLLRGAKSCMMGALIGIGMGSVWDVREERGWVGEG
jgi:hypothetical protein